MPFLMPFGLFIRVQMLATPLAVWVSSHPCTAAWFTGRVFAITIPFAGTVGILVHYQPHLNMVQAQRKPQLIIIISQKVRAGL